MNNSLPFTQSLSLLLIDRISFTIYFRQFVLRMISFFKPYSGIEKSSFKTIDSKKIKCDLNFPAPDYVFEADYDLRTLEESKEYISLNKHLPEIPSAKEMETNGVNLVEMNMSLLKKVEELTLHLIKQNERLEQVETSNREMKQALQNLKKVK